MASYRTRTGVLFDDEVTTRHGRRFIVVKGNEVTGGGESVVAIWVSFQEARRGVSDADRIDAPFYRRCRNSSVYSARQDVRQTK